MKQIIENIIKKNLPEKKDVLAESKSGIASAQSCAGWNLCLREINTSLIADEVLKVVAEKIRKYYEKFEDTDLNIFESTVLYQTREDILQLLTNSSTLEGEQSEHLSPNKENENNE